MAFHEGKIIPFLPPCRQLDLAGVTADSHAMETQDFDYIIVGSGSAGSAMAYRLGEGGTHRILVLEFGGSDIGRTRRISGHILDYPTNLNFSTMVIGDQDIPAVDADGSSVCGTYCRPSCSDLCVGSNTSDLCSERICPYLCSLYDAEDRSADADPIAFLEAQMPVCWVVGFNQELMRRGYDFRDAKRLQATGPVLQDYSSLTLTVEKLGQVEVLE